MDVQTETRRIIQEWLAARPEEHGRLRGTFGIEWQAAYERLLTATYQRMRKATSEEWREWVKIQAAVKHEVDEICGSLRGS